MKLNLPNLLSLSRIPMAIAVAITAAQHSWLLAFALLLIGCITDVADGLVASWLNQKTDFGADVLEPVCDLALTAGAITGLVLTHRLSWIVVFFAALGYGGVQVINSFFTQTAAFTKFGQWFMPCSFILVIELLLGRYAWLGMNETRAVLFITAQMVVSIYLAGLKRGRFADWFSGFTATPA